MCGMGLSRVMGGAVVIAMLTLASTAAIASVKERIDYWRNNYEELTAANDLRAARAHAIFKQIVDAAGKPPGVVPRLFITQRDPLNVSLPIAIPDGWVILSKGTLDICYREPQWGDDRLAFVLAHEVAHQLRGDFWHMQFFQALEASRLRLPQQQSQLEEVRRVLQATDEIWAKELHADERGIMYAAMAGYNTHAIVSEDGRVNFFQEWVEALDPNRLNPGSQSPSHPDPGLRAETIKTRLRQVVSQVEVFDLGLRFYQIGNYTKAIQAFEHFLETFHSREVYHNLAASHHQLALRYYREWQPEALPFKLTLGVDPTTRARGITRGGAGKQLEPESWFHEHIDKAIEFYKTAIGLDPDYRLAYNNLGCALIVKGPEAAFEAIATLQKAHKMAPQAPDILNNLGVAFYLANLPELATQHLTRAYQHDPRDGSPLLNLGKMAHAAGQFDTALTYWKDYLRLDATSSWAALLQRQDDRLQQSAVPPAAIQRSAERVMGVGVAAFEDEVSQTWGKPKNRHRIFLTEAPFQMSRYSQGIVTFSQADEILMILTLPGYQGASAKGVALGSSDEDVFQHYRVPSRKLAMTQGESWVYDSQGISFQLHDGKVVSWLLF